MATESKIYETLNGMGIDRERLAGVMQSKAENWGHLVHAFEVVSVLGVVLQEWPKKENEE